MRTGRRGFIKGAACGLGGAAFADARMARGQAAQPARRYSFETPPPPIPNSEIKETVSSDVVVVGAGIAGLVSALSAAEAGASVCLIEKAPTFSARGGDNTALNSRLHEKLGIQVDAGSETLDIPDGGRVIVGFAVQDIDGNPLMAGSTIKVSSVDDTSPPTTTVASGR